MNEEDHSFNRSFKNNYIIKKLLFAIKEAVTTRCMYWEDDPPGDK